MLKKFFALLAFLTIALAFVPTYADVAPEPYERPKKINTAAISIQKVDEKNKTVTVKIVRRSEGVVGYTYIVSGLTNKNFVISGNQSFGNENISRLTFKYLENEKAVPESLRLEVRISESKVPTPYGVKIRKTSLIRNYACVIKFSRDSKGRLTANLYE